MFRFNLRDIVRDSITGFEGIVIARADWLNGCVVYQVQSKQLKDGVPQKSVGFDEPQLELVAPAEPQQSQAKAYTGGPERVVERTHDTQSR